MAVYPKDGVKIRSPMKFDGNYPKDRFRCLLSSACPLSLFLLSTF